MVKPKSKDFVKHNQQKRDDFITSNQLSKARDYSARIERNLQQVDQTTARLKPQLTQLSESVKQTTRELEQFSASSTKEFSQQYTATQDDATDDRCSLPKSRSSHRAKVKDKEMELDL